MSPPFSKNPSISEVVVVVELYKRNMLLTGFGPGRSEMLDILDERRIICDSVAGVGIESDKAMVGANRGILLFNCVASLVCALLLLLTLHLEERQIQKKKYPSNANFGLAFGKSRLLRAFCLTRLDLLFPFLEETVTFILLVVVGTLLIALLDQCICLSLLSTINQDTKACLRACCGWSEGVKAKIQKK